MVGRRYKHGLLCLVQTEHLGWPLSQGWWLTWQKSQLGVGQLDEDVSEEPQRRDECLKMGKRGWYEVLRTHAREAFLRFRGLTGSEPASAPVSEGGGPGVDVDGPGAGAEAGVVTDGPACCCCVGDG